MAVAFKSSGSGVSTETSAAALSPACPATVDAGDILIAHVFWEGTTTAPSTPSGWTLLDGPRVIETTIARHWVFGKIADGTEDGTAIAFGNPAVTTQRGARVYSFSGRVSGTITDLVTGFAATSHATDPQMPSVTTSVPGSRAVAFVCQNDNNALASATGETGGDWTEAVAEYTANLTPGLALQLQTALPTNNPGTISGGAVAATDDPSGVIGFEVRPSTSPMPDFRDRTMLVGASSKTSATLIVPSGAKAGDVLYIWAYVDTGPTIGLPTGGQTWTEVAQTKSSEGVSYTCFELPNWNGTDTSYTISWTGLGYVAGAIEAFSGVDTTTPRNAVSGTEFKENAASVNAVVDGLTTTVDNCMLISGVFNNQGISVSSSASGWVEDGDQADSPQIAHKTALVAKGAQGSVTHTLGSGVISCTLMVALQPPLTSQKVTLTPATGTNIAQTLSVTKKIFKTLTSPTGTNSAVTLSITKKIFKSLTFAVGSNTGQTLTYSKRKLLSTSIEADSSQPLTFTQIHYRTTVSTSEISSAQSLSHKKVISISTVAETDVTQTISFSKAHNVKLSSALETDTAQIVLRQKAISLSPSSEIDISVGLRQTDYQSIISPIESDKAQALTHLKRTSVSAPTETDSARALLVTHVHYRSIAPTSSTNLTQTLTTRKAPSISSISEISQAISLRQTDYQSLIAVIEADEARAISFSKPGLFSLTPSTEVGIATALLVIKPIFKSITAVSETDSSQPLSHEKSISLGSAAANDTLIVLKISKIKSIQSASESSNSGTTTYSKRATLLAAIEVDSISSFKSIKYIDISPSTESNNAQLLPAIASWEIKNSLNLLVRHLSVKRRLFASNVAIHQQLENRVIVTVVDEDILLINKSSYTPSLRVSRPNDDLSLNIRTIDEIVSVDCQDAVYIAMDEVP